MRQCRITIGEVALDVELLDTPTADALWDAMPFQGSANTWGDEVYFSTPVQLGQEDDAKDVFEAGEIAYWPPGSAIAIAFGPTPASRGSELRLASESNLWGRTSDDVTELRGIRGGTSITVEKL